MTQLLSKPPASMTITDIQEPQAQDYNGNSIIIQKYKADGRDHLTFAFPSYWVDMVAGDFVQDLEIAYNQYVRKNK